MKSQMSNISLAKVGGVSAILFVVIFVVVIVVGVGFVAFLYTDDLGHILPEVNEDRTAYLVSHWGQVVFSLVGLFILPGAYLAFRRWGNLLWVAVLAMVTGTIFFILSSIFDIVIAAELAPRYAELSEATKPSLEVMASTLHQASFAVHAIGHVLVMGIGVALFSLAIIRTSVAPKWVGWLGLLVIGPIFGWFAILEGYSAVVEPFLLPGAIAFLVWMAAVGVVLLRLREPVASATGA